MKNGLRVICGVALLALGIPAYGQQIYGTVPTQPVHLVSYGKTSCATACDSFEVVHQDGCDTCASEAFECTDAFGGCSGGGITFDLELTLFQYAQEGGVADVVGSPGDFDFRASPRIELGYERADGLGIRSRYWLFDQSTLSAAGDIIEVDTYHIDLEMYQRVQIACHTDVEMSAGLRYMYFEQLLFNQAAPGFLISGTGQFGGILGIESRTHLRFGSLYARARSGLMQGNATAAVVLTGPVIIPSEALNNTVQQTELAFGYEIARETSCGVFSARIGAEWQQWTNVAMADTAFGGLGSRDIMEDVGFAGLVFGIGWER